MQINTHHAFWPSATATASATVAEVFPSTATASATAQKVTFGRPLMEMKGKMLQAKMAYFDG